MPSTGSPCDVDEGRAQIVHAVHSVVEVLDTLSGLRREEFEGERSLFLAMGLRELGRDMHDGGMFEGEERRSESLEEVDEVESTPSGRLAKAWCLIESGRLLTEQEAAVGRIGSCKVTNASPPVCESSWHHGRGMKRKKRYDRAKQTGTFKGRYGMYSSGARAVQANRSGDSKNV